MKNKKFLFLVILAEIFLLVCSPAFNASAQGRPLEINYPELNGDRPTTVNTLIPKYVVYIFNFLVWAIGIFAFFVLVYAGFKYLTSAGNVERITDAKNQIWAALLGMVILFGSYLVLISINPQLIAFNLPTLKPIISYVGAGVYLCKQQPLTDSGEDAVEKAWNLFVEYNLTNPTKERQKEIQQQIDSAVIKIGTYCYFVDKGGDIRPDYDNKSKIIYFVPEIKFDNNGLPVTTTEYGAVLYKDREFKGTSNPHIDHITADTMLQVNSRPLTQFLDASSIRPFRLIYVPKRGWKVILYQNPNKNEGFPDLAPKPLIIDTINNPQCRDEWWCSFNLGWPPVSENAWPPESLEITGNLLIILTTPDNRSEVFFSNDNNLVDNLNITDYIDCPYYEREDYNGKCRVASGQKGYIISGAVY